MVVPSVARSRIVAVLVPLFAVEAKPRTGIPVTGSTTAIRRVFVRPLMSPKSPPSTMLPLPSTSRAQTRPLGGTSPGVGLAVGRNAVSKTPVEALSLATFACAYAVPPVVTVFQLPPTKRAPALRRTTSTGPSRLGPAHLVSSAPVSRVTAATLSRLAPPTLVNAPPRNSRVPSVASALTEPLTLGRQPGSNRPVPGSNRARLVTGNWVTPALSTTAVKDPPTTTLPLGRGRMADARPLTPQVWAGDVSRAAWVEVAMTTAMAAVTMVTSTVRTTVEHDDIWAPPPRARP